MYMTARMFAHMIWTFMGLWMLYLIESDTSCLAKWGFPSPFMVYSQDDPKFEE